MSLIKPLSCREKEGNRKKERIGEEIVVEKEGGREKREKGRK